MINYAQSLHTMTRAQRLMLAGLALSVASANVHQPYPNIAPLQHVPTVLVIIAAPLLLARFPLSGASVASLTGFFLLHTLAGRYAYSNVPYDAWALTLTGHSISEFLGATRNGFDRLVHFSFGLLWIAPVSELLRRHGSYGKAASIWTALLFIGAFGAAYEVFEWLLTMLVAPGMADEYNGQQGDPWDSQKDIALAYLGAVLASLRLSSSKRSGRERSGF